MDVLEQLVALEEEKREFLSMYPGQFSHFKLQEIDAKIESLEAELDKQTRTEKQEAQKEEIAELVLGFDLNKVFDNPDANKIFHMALSQLTEKLHAEQDVEFAALTTKLKEAREQLRAAQEREIQLQFQNDSLQSDLAETVKAKEEAERELDERIQEITALNDELHEARTENFQLRDEVMELKEKLDELDNKKTITFTPNESLASVIQTAKEYTEQRKYTNPVKIAGNWYEATNTETGLKEVVNQKELDLPVSPFRGITEVDIQPVEQSADIAESVEIAKVLSFQGEQELHNNAGLRLSDVVIDAVETKSLEERVAELEAWRAAESSWRVTVEKTLERMGVLL